MFQRSLVRDRVYRDRDGGRGREGEEIKIRCAGRYFSVWVYNLCCTTNILFFCMNVSESQSISVFQTYVHDERQATCIVY